MEELFTMQGAVLKELLLMHYKQLKTFDEKMEFLSKVFAWQYGDEGFATHPETGQAVDDFKKEVFEVRDEHGELKPDAMRQFFADYTQWRFNKLAEYSGRVKKDPRCLDEPIRMQTDALATALAQYVSYYESNEAWKNNPGDLDKVQIVDENQREDEKRLLETMDPDKRALIASVENIERDARKKLDIGKGHDHLENRSEHIIKVFSNELENDLKETYSRSVFRTAQYEKLGAQKTNITAESAVRYMVYHSALKNSRWIGGDKQEQIEELEEPVNMLDHHILKIKSRSFGLETSIGTRIQLLGNDDADIVGSHMEKSREFTEELLADKKLMEKEPFLEAYTKLYQMELRKGFSEDENALAYQSDPCYSMMTSLFLQIKKVPSAEELKQLKDSDPGAYKAAEKVKDLFNAYADMQAEADAQREIPPDQIMGEATEELRRRMDEKLKKLEDTAAGFAELPRNDLKQFYETLGARSNDMDIQLDILYDDPKASPAAVTADIEQKRKLLNAGVLPEEADLINEFEGAFRNAVSIKSALGKVSAMASPYREAAERIEALAAEGKQKLKDGFASNEEKYELFRKMGEASRDFLEKCDVKKTGSLPRPEGVSDEFWSVTCFVTDSLREAATYKQGALHKAIRHEERQLTMEKVSNAEFRKQFNSFLDMMEDTGSGYLFHSDSSEYDKMMQTLRAVKQLSGKVPLNDYEMKTYADSCANIAKVCTDYLDREQKLKKQRSDTGSDRFDGALGILNLMDPEAADRIRMKAGEKRGKRIRWEDLNEKAAEKERKRPKRSENAVVKNSASHLLH